MRDTNKAPGPGTWSLCKRLLISALSLALIPIAHMCLAWSLMPPVVGVLLLGVVQNGLNLLGVTPYAFRMIVGLIILIAITTSNLGNLLPRSTRAQNV